MEDDIDDATEMKDLKDVIGTNPLKKLNKVFSGGKSARCPECGEPMHPDLDLCQVCSSTPIIDEVFILYNDGRLIDHMSRTLNLDINNDKDIRSGMIVAVQNYIDGQLKGDIGALEVMKFGPKSVVVLQGKYLVVAVVLERGEVDELKETMQETLEEGEERFASLLKGWDGDKEKLEDLNTLMRKRIIS